MDERQTVTDYIRRELGRGYALESIRQALIDHGYAPAYVEDLIKETGDGPREASAMHDADEEGSKLPAEGKPASAQKAVVADFQEDPPAQSFLEEDFVHLRMPSTEQTLLILLPIAFGSLVLGIYLSGLQVELIDWALIKFSVFLIAGTLTAKAIAAYLRKRSPENQRRIDDAIFEKVMRFGFIIYLLSLAMEGGLLVAFVVIGILVLSYATMKRAKLNLWRSLEVTTLFASMGMGITYAIIFVAAAAIGFLKAKGLP